MTTHHTIEQEDFGKTKDGLFVKLYTLSNSNNITVKITNYGGIIVNLLVPDASGDAEDIVLGYETLEQYFDNASHFGALVGRFAAACKSHRRVRILRWQYGLHIFLQWLQSKGVRQHTIQGY